MNVFSLFAKIGLDTKDYEAGLKDSKGKFNNFADGLKDAAGKVGDVLLGIGKAAAAGVAAAGTALTALTKQSLDAYSEFEQLEGGTKLMFGDAADFIIQKSEEAFKTVQLSQNEYLEQVNGFAVGLKTALGGNEQAAAELADKIVSAEADIVAATGNTQEAVQNAFNGIMKTNYTMLDNLMLGITPTKEGMEEVIDTVNKWNAANGEATEYMIDNLADVQSALVDYVKMQGLAGYASKEAGSTITGSIASVKAAWQNFLTGNGTIEDFTAMLIPTVENIREKLDVIIPRITEGLTELIDQVSPYIPDLIEETLPTIIKGASTLITGLSKRLPQLVTAILPSLTQGVVDVSVALVGVLPDLISSLSHTIPIVVRTIMSKKDELLQTGKDIIAAVFPEGIDGETVKKIVGKSDEIINKLIDGLLSDESITAFLEAAPKLLDNIGDAIEKVLLGPDENGEGGIFGAAKRIVIRLGDYFADEKNRQNFWNAAKKVLKSLAEGIKSILEQGVAPLMVEIAHAWAQCFVGEIDYNDAAWDIITRLGKAFIHNMATGGIIGKWVEEAANESAAEIEENLGPTNDYAIEETAAGMRAAGYPDIAIEQYYKYAYGDSYAMGVRSASRFSRLNNTPTDNAASSGVTIGSVVINAPSGNADDIADAFINGIDEKLRNLQVTKNRGVGATAWK